MTTYGSSPLSSSHRRMWTWWNLPSLMQLSLGSYFMWPARFREKDQYPSRMKSVRCSISGVIQSCGFQAFELPVLLRKMGSLSLGRMHTIKRSWIHILVSFCTHSLSVSLPHCRLMANFIFRKKKKKGRRGPWQDLMQILLMATSGNLPLTYRFVFESHHLGFSLPVVVRSPCIGGDRWQHNWPQWTCAPCRKPGQLDQKVGHSLSIFT